MLAHARRKFFELADIEAAERQKARSEKPKVLYAEALEALRLIDALSTAERQINGASPEVRLAVRR